MAKAKAIASSLLLVLALSSVHVEAITIWDWIAQLTKFTNPYAYTGRPAWKPKQDSYYKPEIVSWKSVISACRAAVKYEKRLGNFFIRAAFHDSMAVNLTACLTGNTVACGGADSSLFLSLEEMTRPENSYDNFSALAAKAVRKIATYYGASVSDSLAVCAAVAVEVQSGGRIQIVGRYGLKNFRVGRLDNITPSPPGTLPPATFTLDEFVKWWGDRGFSVDEAIALMGSHSLIDEQGCLKGPTPNDYCDPADKTCVPRMFQWANHFYHDACTPTLTIQPEAPHTFNDTAIVEMADAEFVAAVKREKCKFTSPEFRMLANAEMEMIRAQVPGHVEPPDVQPDNVTWSNTNCQDGSYWGAKSCPHPTTWFYTLNDAFMAKACQATDVFSLSWNAQLVRSAMRRYLYQPSWDDVFISAFQKMTTKFANFAPLPLFALPVNIDGKECPPGHIIDQVCNKTVYGNRLSGSDSSNCWGCDSGIWCNQCCKCQDAFGMGDFSFKPSVPTNFPPPPPPAQPIDVTQVVVAPTPALPKPEIPINPGGGVFPDVPPSPYNLPAGTCSGTKVMIQGYPSSPFVVKVFQNAFQNPPPAMKQGSRACLPATPSTCMDSYNIDVTEVTRDLKAGCSARLTSLLAYGGSVPGPTFNAPVGTQVMVRFTNNIPATSTAFPKHGICASGRPISIHHHGSASIAPHDGWADNVICAGQYKDYVYPVNRAGTGWYHDHAIEVTSENAHAGLAGFFLAKYDTALGTVADRWGLDGMTEYNLMLQDKVMDANCQLLFDKKGVHKNDHFGDINMVSGIPFPVLTVEPKWVRFRLVNAAIARPWLLQIVDNKGVKVAPTICKVIAGDGGYRRSPIDFPVNGLFMTIAERYEFVCNFAAVANQTLYLWNHKDDARMKGVPFFCNSHLVMKIQVQATCPSCALSPVFNPAVQPATKNALDPIITPIEYETMLNQSKAGVCTRSFKFGRGNGQWVINGETWHSAKIAANVTHSTMEIWCLETPGGWYHSIHIHLVDFYVLRRQAAGEYQVEELYEKEVPKDVVALHAGSKVSLLVRWGPHRGEYMFHCHVLTHEDSEMLRAFSTNKAMPASLPNNSPDARFATVSNTAFINGNGKMYDKYYSAMYSGAVAKDAIWSFPPAVNDYTYMRDTLAEGVYGIFYPVRGYTDNATLLCDPNINPWLVRPC